MDRIASNPEADRTAPVFAMIVRRALELAEATYGDRLVSFAVFGSVARSSQCATSDVDLLLVVEDLPPGRIRRMREFRDGIEGGLGPVMQAARAARVHTRLAPVFKTRAEATAGTPLFLDMTQDASILKDRDGFLRARLDRLKDRMKELGSRRVWTEDGKWYWILKPDYTPGEVFEL